MTRETRGLPRFYAPALEQGSDTVVLSQDESHHLVHVLRLSRNAPVLVFDGRGAQFFARVAEAGRRRATLRVGERVPSASESSIAVTLAPAVLKNEAMDSVVRDATMLGVTRICPVIASRTVVSRRLLAGTGASDRWHRVAVSAAKQCGRAVVPAVLPPRPLEEVLDDASVACRVMLVEPSTAEAALLATPDEITSSAVLFVGPEGGWTPEEVALARERGVRLWSLGGLTLRAETAPTVALGIVSYVARQRPRST
jgi:16S rRNA (uracil1498-N3)-methyltransferase